MDIYIKVNVASNFESALDRQIQIEREINEGRWLWDKCVSVDAVSRTEMMVSVDLNAA